MTHLRAALNYYKMRSSWLGDGGQPVPIPQAQERANTCLKCPKNQPHPIWESVTAHEAKMLRQQIQLRSEMKLAVQGEGGLRVCDACLCLLPQKVWAPIKHIKETTPLEALHPDCWILREAGITPTP